MRSTLIYSLAFFLLPGLAGAAADPDSALEVNPEKGIVLMGYEPWFGPKGVYYANAPHQPTLSSASTAAVGRTGYDSSDEAIIKKHAAWFAEAGVDAILMDHTNGGGCTFGDVAKYCPEPATQAHFRAIRDNVSAIYKNVAANKLAIKIVPMLSGEDNVVEPNADGETSWEKELRFYVELQEKYPQLSVLYGHQPLVVVFTGAAQDVSESAPWRKMQKLADQKFAGKFTLRFMAGYVGQQPQLLKPKTGAAGLPEAAIPFWNWIERYKPDHNLLPAYVRDATGRVEAFTAQLMSPPDNSDGVKGWKNADGTYHPQLAPRLGGQTFRDWMKLAKELRPTFLVINQWNCFCEGSDGGVDYETTNDFEPSSKGSGNFELLKEELSAYRNPPAAPEPGFYITSNGAVYASNGSDICSFADPATFTALTGLTGMGSVKKVEDRALTGVPNSGTCTASRAADFAPAGLFMTKDGAVYNSNGIAFCGFPDPATYMRLTGRKNMNGIPKLSNPPKRLHHDGVCFDANERAPAGSPAGTGATGADPTVSAKVDPSTPSSLEKGFYITPEGAVYASDGKDFCSISSPAMFTSQTGQRNMDSVRKVTGSFLARYKNAGECSGDRAADFMPAGLFMTLDGAVFNSNGLSYCGYPDPASYTRLTGRRNMDGIPMLASAPTRLQNDGPCQGATVVSEGSYTGLFMTSLGSVYNSDGKSICGFPDPVTYVMLTGRQNMDGLPVHEVPPGLVNAGTCK